MRTTTNRAQDVASPSHGKLIRSISRPTPAELKACQGEYENEICKRYLLHYGMEALSNALVGAGAVQLCAAGLSPSVDTGFAARFGLGDVALPHEDTDTLRKALPPRFSASLKKIGAFGLYVPEKAFSDGLLFGEPTPQPDRRIAIAGEDNLNLLFRVGQPRSFPAAFLHQSWSSTTLDNPLQAGGLFLLSEQLWNECRKRLETPADKSAPPKVSPLIDYYNEIFRALRRELEKTPEFLDAAEGHLKRLLTDELKKSNDSAPHSTDWSADLIQPKAPPMRATSPIPVLRRPKPPTPPKPVAPPKTDLLEKSRDPRIVKSMIVRVNESTGEAREHAINAIVNYKLSEDLDPLFAARIKEAQTYAQAVRDGLDRIVTILNTFDEDKNVAEALTALDILCGEAYPSPVQTEAEIAKELVEPTNRNEPKTLRCQSNPEDPDSVMDTLLQGARNFDYAKVFMSGLCLEGIPLLGDVPNSRAFRLINPSQEYASGDIPYQAVERVEIWERAKR